MGNKMKRLIGIKTIKASLDKDISTEAKKRINAFLDICSFMSLPDDTWGVNPKSLEVYLGRQLFDELFSGCDMITIEEGDTNG